MTDSDCVEWPVSRSIRVFHLDAYVTRDTLLAGMETFGPVEKCEVREGDMHTFVGYVLYNNSFSVDKLFKGFVCRPICQDFSSSSRSTRHQPSDPADLQQKLSNFIEELRLRRLEEEAQSSVAEVDADGFTLVKYTGKFKVDNAKVSSQTMKAASKKRMAEKLESSTSLLLPDFYRFQHKEKKLREWKDDKQRLQEEKQKCESLIKKRRISNRSN